MEVIKNYYNEHADNESESFNHPHSLREQAHLVRHFLRHPIQSAMGSRPATPASGMDADAGQEGEAGPGPSRTSTLSPPASGPKIVHIDPARIGRGTQAKPTLRQRLFGRLGGGSTDDSRARGRSPTDHDAEEGQAYLSPRDPGFTPPRIHEPEPELEPESILSPSTTNNNLTLERTATGARSIRFTPDTAEASDTAPAPPRSGSAGQSGYGLLTPGFKRNPGLSMSRTRSINADAEEGQGQGQSVSFQEPEIRR